MSSKIRAEKKLVRIRSAIDGFDAKYKQFPSEELTLVTVPQISSVEKKVGTSQLEVARAYVNKLLLQALEDGIRVKYAYLGELSKERRKELEALQKIYPDLLVLGHPRGKSQAVRGQTLTRLLNKMNAVHGTDLILIDGVEMLSREQLAASKGCVESCYLEVPNNLKFYARICHCPAVVVQLETHSKIVPSNKPENLWLQNAEMALSLRHRGGLCLVGPDGTVRRGLEARVVKAPGGREEEDCWMV